jgi:S-adenosylmethionine hydrolase
MKGVILATNPAARLVDITHEIPGQDIADAAFTLLAAYREFSPGTIHLSVVDPGVGSPRRPILICSRDYFFVGPDNGIFSYIMEREKDVRVFALTNREYFREPLSNTFHGRDIFAPVAAALSTGVSPRNLGNEIDDPVQLESLKPTSLKNGDVAGRVIHIDRFGNCVTSFTPGDLHREQIGKGLSLKLKGKAIKQFRNFYSEQDTKGDDLFAIWGSAGFLEVAACNGSAADRVKAKIGDRVVISSQQSAISSQ